MRILQVLAPARFGGLERVVQGLAIGHTRRGHEVRVAVLTSKDLHDNPLIENLGEEGVDVDVIKARGRAYVRQKRMLEKLIRQVRPSVVHSHGYHADVVGASAARRTGIPVISTAHGFTGGDLKNRIYESIQRATFRRLDTVIAVSEPLRERLVRSGVRADRVVLLRNAWVGVCRVADQAEARGRLGLSRSGFHIGWVGRMTREKGLDLAVEALALLGRPDVTLSLIGDGPEERVVRELARTLGCSEQLSWHGEIPNAGTWLKAFDAVIISSRTEGTPMVLFEAMAAEVPLVVTAVGGIPDVVGTDTAFLVPPEAPHELSHAVLSVIHEPRKAGEMAASARERLDTDYSVGPWLAAHEELYEGLTTSSTSTL